MKVLLTGAYGFLGSHILDALCESGEDVRVLLRRTSDTRFIEQRLPQVEVHYGSLTDTQSLTAAARGIECVIHCAGKTKVVRASEFYAANKDGARNVAEAANASKSSVRRLILISSRAVLGPSVADRPAAEDDAPAPVSEYGRSKLEGEREVKACAQMPVTILRPSAIYGPRDVEFLPVFRAVKAGFAPLFGGGRQQINLVYAPDVAQAVLRAMNAPEAAGRAYNVASPEVTSSRQLLEEIARQLDVHPIKLPLPMATLYPVCLLQEVLSRLTHRASMLSRQKYRELRAAGWVCSSERMREELGFVCPTGLREGVARTIDWYKTQGRL